jgi:hypothetical protein
MRTRISRIMVSHVLLTITVIPERYIDLQNMGGLSMRHLQARKKRRGDREISVCR